MPKSGAPRRLGPAWIAAAVLAAAPAARAGALDLYYERALMSAADARCGLFAPDVRSALEAAKVQARGAALRSGSSEPALQAVGARAQARAAAVACGAPDLKLAAGRVREAFKNYGLLRRMAFPGDAANWAADRSLPERTPVWRLVQSASDGADPLSFGLAGRWGDAQALVATVADGTGERPYAARLLVRNPARAPGAYVNAVAPGAAHGPPLSARAAPRPASLVFEAQERAPAGPSLAPPGGAPATAFRFPAAAIGAIAALDPREAVTVELLYEGQGRETARRAYIEVGDFAAGLAFLAAARR